MNLESARAALAAAEFYNTADAWKAAALAMAQLASAGPVARKPRAPKSTDIMDSPWTEKRAALHSVRCTLTNGYTVRVTVGQWKGETPRDTLAKMERFTLACYRADALCVRPVADASGTVDYLPCRPWADGARMLHTAESVADCRIVRWGHGPDAGIDSEELAQLADAA